MSKRVSKRKKTIHGKLETDEDGKHEVFTGWSKGRGVEINGVKPARLPHRGLGLVTTKPIKKDERILFIPEKAMFKPNIAVLTRERLAQSSPQAKLSYSAMIAFRDSNDPPNAYIWENTWPTKDDLTQSMPMFWPESHTRLLPPSVRQPLERQVADYQKDWNAVGRLCSARGFNEEDFKYYWMIVNSRSFHWKPAHGKSGTMVMCPFIDYLNHGPTGSGCLVSMDDNGYEVTATRKYDAGEEVLVTYGAHSNDKLLVHYGFINSSSHSKPSADDDIRLDHLILPKLSPEIQRQLQDVGFLGAYSLVPATNELCFKTQVAVRAALLTCNEWEHFMSSGDDLGLDHTQQVNDFVKVLLSQYRSDAVQRLQDTSKLEESTARSILSQRWQQIIDAVDKFTGA